MELLINRTFVEFEPKDNLFLKDICFSSSDDNRVQLLNTIFAPLTKAQVVNCAKKFNREYIFTMYKYDNSIKIYLCWPVFINKEMQIEQTKNVKTITIFFDKQINDTFFTNLQDSPVFYFQSKGEILTLTDLPKKLENQKFIAFGNFSLNNKCLVLLGYFQEYIQIPLTEKIKQIFCNKSDFINLAPIPFILSIVQSSSKHTYTLENLYTFSKSYNLNSEDKTCGLYEYIKKNGNSNY